MATKENRKIHLIVSPIGVCGFESQPLHQARIFRVLVSGDLAILRYVIILFRTTIVMVHVALQEIT